MKLLAFAFSDILSPQSFRDWVTAEAEAATEADIDDSILRQERPQTAELGETQCAENVNTAGYVRSTNLGAQIIVR